MAVSGDFIAEKIRQIFPNAVTTPGSQIYTDLIQPLTNLFSGYDASDFEDFLATRIAEYDSSIVTSPGTANYDILISSLTALFEPLWWEIKTLKEWQTLENYQVMPDEELDALVSNYFMTRQAGAKARGSVRVYFSSPTTVTFSQFVRFLTRSGYGFIPEEVKAIQADTMSFNQEGGLYYTDVVIEAESEGVDYNILANQIVEIENLPASYVRVYNSSSFTGGEDKETNEDLYTRAQDAITVRNLVTKRGARYNLLTEFPRVSAVEAVGFGDYDMERDLEQFGLTTTTTITKLLSGGIAITTGSVTVTAANYIHVGGKVDLYTYTSDLVEGYMDITNLDPSSTYNLGTYTSSYVKLPILRVKDIERLDPLYQTQTGQYLPYRHPVDARAYRDFYFSTDEYSLERGVGTVRLFFDRPTSMTVTGNTTFTADNGQIFRPITTQSITASGMELNAGQKITQTAMDSNLAYTAGVTYYYFDVSVQSDNAGDDTTLLSENDYLSVETYTSEGWSLSTQDETLAFSTRENLLLSFTSTFNDGISLSGESVRVVYEYAPTITDMQTYVDNDDIRVVTSDLLVKHFQPAYVDLAITYSGTPTEEDMELYIRNFINSIDQNQYFEVADLISTLYDYGATHVSLPIEVFVLVMDKDRKYYAVRFEDRYRVNRRTHLVARNINVTQA